ncbi:MAG: CHAT domain-containing protein [Fimbriimonadia bacterium]|nr:CHAT domain-containing protein [Fimbriimonadia bacterium]
MKRQRKSRAHGSRMKTSVHGANLSSNRWKRAAKTRRIERMDIPDYPENLSQDQFLWLQAAGSRESPALSLTDLQQSPCPLQTEWFQEACAQLKTESPRQAQQWLNAARGIKAVARSLDHLPLLAFAQTTCAQLARISAQWNDALQDASEAKLLAAATNDLFLQSECGLIEGAVYTETGRYSNALLSYQECMGLYEQLDDFRGIASCYYNMGLIHFRAGKIPESLALVDQARSLFKQIGHSRNIGICLMTQGNAHRHLGHWTESLNYYKQARKLFEELGDQRRIASCFLNAGNVYSDMNRLPEARSMYEKAMEVFEALGEQGRVGGCHLNLGLTYLQSQQAEETLRRCHLARPLFERLGDAMRIAECDLYEGLALAHMGRPQEAVALLSQAQTFFEQAGDDRQTALCLYHQGRLLRLEGKVVQAITLYEKALEAVEAIHDNSPHPEFAQSLTRALEGLGAALAGCLIEQNRLVDALQSAQRAKGAALRSAMLEERSHSFDSQLSEQESRQLEELRNDFASARQLLQQTPLQTPAHARSLADCQRSLAALSAYETLLRAKHSTALPSSQTKPASLQFETLPHSLSPQTGVLEILVDELQLCLLLVTVSGGKVHLRAERIAVQSSELRETVQRYLQSLAQNGTDTDLLARWLYRHLIEPIESSLSALKTLVLCPEPYLCSLPFGSLIDPNGEYLIQRMGVATAPSLSVWEACQQLSQQRDALSAPLVIALSHFEENEQSSARPLFTGARLRDLPHALQEAQSVAQILGSNTRFLSNDQATLNETRQHMRDASLIHFATHALIQETTPMMSALVISPNAQGEPELLYAREIGDMRLQAHLAVLSACSTLQGPLVVGEGLIGLAWAFLRAGCPATLATCWAAHDHAARLWVEAFYSAYTAGQSKAESARAACISLLQSEAYASPHYWANWILIGNDS